MKQKSQLKKFVSDLIFYGILLSLVVATLAISGSGTSGPRVFGGYSAFVVLTGSMEDVIPKGSLVVTKRVDAGELQVGDDITYMVSETTTVTHRIIEIEENYLETGQRAFRTQGVMNEQPDLNPVAEVNVVGKVIYHNKLLGTIVNFGQENWPLLIFFLVVFLCFVKIAEMILRKEPQKEEMKFSEKEKTEEQTTVGEDGFVLEIIDLSK